ncbi:MAG TPA: hypothetical protein VKQ52_05130 [Puia sp.]|nr:hypothetical protein [Puia sp.]
MTLSSPLRKLALLVHVTTSIAWPGAIAAFLALAITGLTSTDTQIVRSVYVAMPPITWYVIVPLAFAALLTGLLLSLGTKWSLLRHYWVLIKLLINAVSIPILLLHARIIQEVASAAEKTTLSGTDLHDQRVQLVTVSIAALLALIIATILSLYKPRGITPYGWSPKKKEDSLVRKEYFSE